MNNINTSISSDARRRTALLSEGVKCAQECQETAVRELAAIVRSMNTLQEKVLQNAEGLNHMLRMVTSFGVHLDKSAYRAPPIGAMAPQPPVETQEASPKPKGRPPCYAVASARHHADGTGYADSTYVAHLLCGQTAGGKQRFKLAKLRRTPYTDSEGRIRFEVVRYWEDSKIFSMALAKDCVLEDEQDACAYGPWRAGRNTFGARGHVELFWEALSEDYVYLYDDAVVPQTPPAVVSEAEERQAPNAPARPKRSSTKRKLFDSPTVATPSIRRKTKRAAQRICRSCDNTRYQNTHTSQPEACEDCIDGADGSLRREYE